MSQVRLKVILCTSTLCIYTSHRLNCKEHCSEKKWFHTISQFLSHLLKKRHPRTPYLRQFIGAIPLSHEFLPLKSEAPRGSLCRGQCQHAFHLRCSSCHATCGAVPIGKQPMGVLWEGKTTPRKRGRKQFFFLCVCFFFGGHMWFYRVLGLVAYYW